MTNAQQYEMLTKLMAHHSEQESSKAKLHVSCFSVGPREISRRVHDRVGAALHVFRDSVRRAQGKLICRGDLYHNGSISQGISTASKAHGPMALMTAAVILIYMESTDYAHGCPVMAHPLIKSGTVLQACVEREGRCSAKECDVAKCSFRAKLDEATLWGLRVAREM